MFSIFIVYTSQPLGLYTCIQLDITKFKLLVVYICMSCVASLNYLFFQTRNHSELLAYDGPLHENHNYTF